MEEPGTRPISAVPRTKVRAVSELEQLRSEIEHLRRENVLLRSEVTRLRLYQDIDLDASGDQVPLPDSLPTDARRFYLVLPDVFDAQEYSRIASELGLPVDISQRYLDTFLRECLLQRIARDQLRKTDRYPYRLASS